MPVITHAIMHHTKNSVWQAGLVHVAPNYFFRSQTLSYYEKIELFYIVQVAGEISKGGDAPRKGHTVPGTLASARPLLP